MIDDILFMHFSLPLRITSSSNNEKGRRELLEHQGTANPALYLEKKDIAMCSVQVGRDVYEANTIPVFRSLSFFTHSFHADRK